MLMLIIPDAVNLGQLSLLLDLCRILFILWIKGYKINIEAFGSKLDLNN